MGRKRFRAAMSTDEEDLRTLLETGESFLKAGQPLDALKILAPSIQKHNCDADIYEKTASAFLQYFLPVCFENTLSVKLDLGFDEDKLLETLTLQKECPSDYHCFLAALSHHNAIRSDACPIAARRLIPVFRKICQQRKINKNFVLLLIFLREWMAPLMTQAEISRLHKEYFREFTRDDMALSYRFVLGSVCRRNRQDLIEIAAGVKADWDNRDGIELYHILFLAWVVPEAFDFLNDTEKILKLIKIRFCEQAAKHPDSLKAAKTLLLRYVKDERNGIGVDIRSLLANLCCSEKYSLLLGETIKKRATLMRDRHKPHVNFMKLFMQTKVYQGVNVLKNIIPAQIRPGSSQKLKVAICISGQLRGFREAFLSWGNTLLKNIDYDIYVHTWKRVGGSEPLPYRPWYPWKDGEFTKAYRSVCYSLGYEEMKKRYVSFFESFGHQEIVSVEDLARVYNTKYLVVEDDAEERFVKLSNLDKMYYKIFACHQYMMSCGKDYDLCVRIRPDKPISLIGFDWYDLYRRCKTEPVIFADLPMCMHFGSPAMGDAFAVGAPGVMSLYSDAWNFFPAAGAEGLYDWSKNFLGHTSLAQVCWVHGISVERIPMKSLGCIDADTLSLESIHKKIEIDAKNRMDDIDQRLLQASARDLRAKFK